MMAILRALMMLVLVSLLASCSSHVSRPDDAQGEKPAVRALQDFELVMSPQAEVQLSDNVQFELEALQDIMQRTLNSRRLVAADGDYRLRVVVTDIRVRSTFSAMMWGFMAGNDHIRGDVSVLNLDGESVYEFTANAAYALGGIGGGQDEARMGWLYQKFSEIIADELVEKRDADD